MADDATRGLLEKLAVAIRPLYSEFELVGLSDEQARHDEALTLFDRLNGRSAAKQLLDAISRHESCQLSALREVLYMLSQRVITGAGLVTA